MSINNDEKNTRFASLWSGPLQAYPAPPSTPHSNCDKTPSKGAWLRLLSSSPVKNGHPPEGEWSKVLQSIIQEVFEAKVQAEAEKAEEARREAATSPQVQCFCGGAFPRILTNGGCPGTFPKALRPKHRRQSVCKLQKRLLEREVEWRKKKKEIRAWNFG
ncbi:hypothetical protein K470DRAFT_267436 [Piedraia hortae CBS 480.64]|uniref:Uncharacterized protein n=1 Tax=Piedraia hortae CBS 480.64 TaxID=1314780 RepID=A0A6A7C914_9PEZI|nr:hypothetical protein K470DRAFT_267436 [Piedraia hortae CBS 480.64]